MQRSLRDILDDVNGLAQRMMDQVGAFAAGGGGARQPLEQTALKGLAASGQALEELSQMLESARMSRQDAEPIADAIGLVEQKLAFFQGCTMRRSAARGHDEDAEDCASEAEELAAAVLRTGGLFELIEAYKKTEALEAEIAELRGAIKPPPVPEPRVLDLPRARVLVARRAIGAAVVELDGDDEDY